MAGKEVHVLPEAIRRDPRARDARVYRDCGDHSLPPVLEARPALSVHVVKMKTLASFARRDLEGAAALAFLGRAAHRSSSAHCLRDVERSWVEFARQGALFFSEVPASLRGPNQAPEPTATLVTSRADARLASSASVAHL